MFVARRLLVVWLSFVVLLLFCTQQTMAGAYTNYKSDKNLALLKKPVILRAESWLDDRRLCKQGEESPGFVGQSAR